MPRRNPIQRCRGIGVGRSVAMVPITHSSQTFNTGGTNTFKVPAGVLVMQIEMWGRGGNGGVNALGQGGGGGAAYARRNASVVIPGETLTLYVGDQTSSPTNVKNQANTTLGIAGPGGNSSGQGAGAAGSNAVSQGDVENAGAVGGTGDATGGGGGGASAGPANVGVAGANAAGTGGAGGVPPTGGGAGGAGGNAAANGTAGTQPGGGGGGGGAGATAGLGGLGRIVLTW